ncbi:MAG: hypothetical protein SFW36_05735 [Leptolyngbyaceae cyanobacterium bins.59]|nr:hypothetical protein [Leptolyngbyaceae cyanobacterium bins.59]
MEWWMGGLLYIGTHFLIYALVLRHWKPFSHEKGIFLYHVVSELLLMGAIGGFVLLAPAFRNWADIVAIVSLHSIYSLSFLELWALCDSGYSLSILSRIKAGRPIDPESDLLEWQTIVSSKKQNRVQGLQGLKLVRLQGNQVYITNRGRFAVFLLKLLSWPANLTR